MSTGGPGIDDIETRVVRTEALTKDELDMVHHLFDQSYRQAKVKLQPLDDYKHRCDANSGAPTTKAFSFIV